MFAKFEAHNVTWGVDFYDADEPENLYVMDGWKQVPVSWDLADALCDHPMNIRGIVYRSKRGEFDDAMFAAMAEEAATYGKPDAMDEAKERMHD